MRAAIHVKVPVYALMLGLVLLFCSGAGSSGAERERQLAARLVETVEEGEPLWLQASGHEFLSLHNAAMGALPRQAVLLIHNMGGHPDWPEVIAPLRMQLPEHGWGTLSLQMPLLASRALADDYGRTVAEAGRRISAGVSYLREQNYACIVLAGYGFGATEALAYLAEQGDADGLITISVLAREFLQPALDVTALLTAIDIPVLDIYGRQDFHEVINGAQARKMVALEAEIRAYDQYVIEGADHYFTGQQQRLVAVVQEWLDATYGDHGCAVDSPDTGNGRLVDQGSH